MTENNSILSPGKWHAVFDENGKCTEVLYDESYRKLLGFESEKDFANSQESWKDAIHPDDRERLDAALADGMSKHPEGLDVDVEYRMMTKRGYRWFHDYAHCARREDGSPVRCDGIIFDIQDIKDSEQLNAHYQIRKEFLNYVVNNDEDPIEMLKLFAERIRVVMGCDQVIYRDLQETRVFLNSPAINSTWSVPEDYCKQCPHFDAHHPLYSEGYTEMSNCQEGWKGYPVYHDCPIKSSLTRLVYCNGEISGYFAIHYVRDYHSFTDIERQTLEEFINNFSLVLSRYEARKEASQMQGMKRTMKLMFSLSDEFDPIMVLDPETGEYDWYMSLSDDVTQNTAMSSHGTEFYKDVGIDMTSIIHEEDRERFKAFYSRENMMKIVETGETQETENRWFIRTEGMYKWKYNKVVKMVDETGKAFVVIGVIDTTEKKKQEEQRKTEINLLNALRENNQRVMALEDNFESLYDVEMYSGKYIAYVKGEFYQENVVDKLLTPGDYFEDLRENIDAVIYPEDRDSLFDVLNREAIRKALSENDRFEHYYRILLDGNPMWFKIRVTYKDSDKNNVIIGVFNADQEVSEKQKAEKQREMLLEQMAGDDGVFIVDCVHNSMKVVHDAVNRKEHVTDCDNYYDAISQYIKHNTAEVDREMMLRETSIECMQERLKKTKGYSILFRDTNSGSQRYFSMKVNSLSDTEILLSFKDCDEEIILKHVNDKVISDFASVFLLDLENDTFRFLSRSSDSGFKNVPGGVYSETIQEYISRVHPDYRKIWNHARDAEGVRSLITDKDRAEYVYPLEGVGKRWRRCTIQRLESRNGVPISAIMTYFVIDDVAAKTMELSEQVAKQKIELEAAYKEAKDANAAKSNFLFNMSHDIRTPMNAITGFTMMAKKSVSNTDLVLDYLNKIDVSSQQLLLLVNQVLEMARIESGKITFVMHPVNIKDRYDAMVTVLAEQAEAHGLKFNASLVDAKHLTVLADDARMGQVTLNIAGNAMKYTPEGGTIDFTVKEIAPRQKDHATYVFTVADTGIGMSEEYLKDIFEPFSRENNSTVSKIQGTGLGLSIVKSLVDLAGGKIEVHSAPGKGSRFDITLDFKIVDEVSMPQKEAVDSTDLSNIFKGKRVLLVEDNDLNREIARFILSENGIVVEEAEDGDIAVNRISKIAEEGNFHYYDFILMDVQMPRMDGYKATAKIREILEPIGIHIPIIAISANAFEEDRKKSHQAGMDDHIAKPIDVDNLWETLKKFA